MPYRVPVASVSTQPSSTSVRSSMYRLDFGYPTASCTEARECIPGRPAKGPSNSTVRTADLTCAPPPVSPADIALDPFVRREIVSDSVVQHQRQRSVYRTTLVDDPVLRQYSGKQVWR